MTTKPSVILNNVTHQYGSLTVLDNVCVSFLPGKIHGLIGRNGSGKTMLMRAICGFVKPAVGEIRVFEKRIGKDVDFPDNTGVVMDCMGFIPYYNGYRNLYKLSKLNMKNPQDYVNAAMILLGLDPTSKKRVSKYSLGMHQRLLIAQAIMLKPRLLLLDEPFNGIDNDGVSELYKILDDMRTAGVTILLASHHNNDINSICDSVYEMNAGKIMQQR